MFSRLLFLPLLLATSVYSEEFKHLTNDTKCAIYMYTLGGEFQALEKAKDGGGFKNVSSVEFEDPKNVESECNDKEKIRKQLILSYEKNLKLTIHFYNPLGSWEIKNITASYAPDKSVAFTSDNMYAAKKFSWSCNKLKLLFRGEVNNVTTHASLTLNRFQIQPFEGTDKVVFFDSYDCTTWFTIPLWMGFITLFMFTFIAAIGVYLLFSIKTMDKFENPKGKTITVPVGD